MNGVACVQVGSNTTISMVSTTFVNKTSIDFKLKEGNAGVYRDLAVLKGVDADGQPRPDGQHTVTLDLHATYREYTVVATGQKTKKRVLVSSDMCQDNSVISIIKNNSTGKFETDCEARKKPGDGSQTSNHGQSGSKLSNLMSSFWKNITK